MKFLDAIWLRIKAEPAIVTMLINQVFLFAAAFGFDLTTEQLVQINGLFAMALTFITRQNVTPISKMSKVEVDEVSSRPPPT